ncbi:GDP-L-fucose synthase [Methylobacterium sp. Leaf89]|uniref:GDP-L-fucose synthase family protein n=1 Tax=Methylobacterium sp. Leaf89 TaxID=1736245 RepID=UPI0009EAAEFF|nr:GDP-L-fucose synthase [Methylobacterium sp. Leaf89]
MKRKIWVAGHNGMVGSAIVEALELSGENVLKVNRLDLDLRDQSSVTNWLKRNRPDIVIFAAAKVGGIYANDTLPADFLYDNIVLATNVIHGSHLADIDRLIFLGSSCIYPKFAPQPIREDALLTGSLEPTNEWYAISKIAGIKLCQAYRKQHNRDYISVMPCNLYGEKDNFNLMSGHVIPALMRKFHEAKIEGSGDVTIWGSGTPKREFLHVRDLARGVIHCMNHYSEMEHINCGAGSDQSIFDLASILRDVTQFKGGIIMDQTKPDGTPRKLMDSSRMRSLGWEPSITLPVGLSMTYDWFKKHVAHKI